MTVTVHVGLPNAQDETLRKLFLATPEITYLGRGVNETLDSANTVLARPGDWDPAPVKAAFDEALAGGVGPGVLSGSYLTSWRVHSPRYWGGELAEVMETPKLLMIIRRTVPWAWDFYFSRLRLLRPDTFAGPSAWAEKHLSQFRIGSELAQVQFTKTLEQLARGCEASGVRVLPAEMLEQDPQGFLDRVDEFVGAGGALSAKAGALEIVPDNSLDDRVADAFRVFRFYRRDREQFLSIMDAYAKVAHRPSRAEHAELRQDPDTSLDAWTAWFSRVRFVVRRAILRGDEALLAAVPPCEDYELRTGLAAYLNEIEVAEADQMKENFGLDLRAYGYAAEAAPVAS